MSSTGFSPGQQPEFRQLIAAAWAFHLKEEPAATKCRGKRCRQCDYCEWYVAALQAACGKTSTTACNRGRDYDRVMAHFETLGCAGIRWQMRVHDGDARRILFNLREAQADHALTEEYLQGVARRMLKRQDLPELEHLTAEHLIIILGEVKRHLRRKAKRESKTRDVGELAKPADKAAATAGVDRPEKASSAGSNPAGSPDNCPF